MALRIGSPDEPLTCYNQFIGKSNRGRFRSLGAIFDNRKLGRTMTMNQQTRKRGADTAFPRLLGDRLCLDFANTIEGPRGANPEEFLRSYADLVRWGRHAATLSEGEADHLLHEATRRPAEAALVFERAIALRATITRVFSAIASK